MTFTVASYNIHKAEGLDGRVDLGRIARVLREVDADVVGIQEVYGPQAEVLAGDLGMGLAMGPTRLRGGVAYGNAVLSRLIIRRAHVFDLTRPAREPRGGLRVDMTVAGRTVHLFNVHFGLTLRERAEQVTLLLREHAARGLEGPRVVIGDLNEWFPGSVGRALGRELHGPRIRRTHPAPIPLFPLDRIYWDRELHADGFHVHRSRLARVASDHLPVVARLRVPVQARPRA
jgi:endonuclease/exonuclease/phosphatase family metal-dependent hydrolase